MLRPALVTLCLCAFALTGTATAQAADSTIGPPTPAITGTPAFTDVSGIGEALQTAFFPGADLTAPADGRIARWRAYMHTGNQARLAVIRRSGCDYTIVGLSGLQTATSDGVHTFTTSVPVVAGDEIALLPAGPFTYGGSILLAGILSSRATTGTIGSDLGGTLLLTSNAYLWFNADFTTEPEPEPVADKPGMPYVTKVAPGEARRGSAIVVQGGNFDLATGVYFDAVPADVWWVDGYGQITALVPPGVPSGPVSVRVAGSTTLTEATRPVELIVDDDAAAPSRATARAIARSADIPVESVC